ncbi:MAG: TlpA family protein disulfide reductase [Bacteroidetes bacterium]|nr:TlpA family protein disulfide reductase [Bacteroidota bacterium]
MKKVFICIVLLSFFSLKSYGQTYSDFTLQDLEGNEIKLSKLLEKGPVMISFWATWCSPCKEEMKKMYPVYEKYKDNGFTYLAVNQDNQKSISKVKSFIKANGYTFPVVLDPDKSVFESYSGLGIPYSLLISKDRKIISKHLGYVTGDEIKIESEIKSVMPAEE